jgi:serine protease inhibitor
MRFLKVVFPGVLFFYALTSDLPAKGATIEDMTAAICRVASMERNTTVERLVNGIHQRAFNLQNLLSARDPAQNRVLPSIHTGILLGMLYSGLAGDAKRELGKWLGFADSPSPLESFYSSLVEDLQSASNIELGLNHGYSWGNGFYGSFGAGFVPAFMHVLRIKFLADAGPVSDSSLQRVNDYFCERTAYHCLTFLDSVPQDFVMQNASYYGVPFDFGFNKGRTDESHRFYAPGKIVQTPIMFHYGKPFLHYDGEGFQLASLTQGEFVLQVFLPDFDPSAAGADPVAALLAFEAFLTYDKYLEAVTKQEKKNFAVLGFPRLKLETIQEDILPALGPELEPVLLPKSEDAENIAQDQEFRLESVRHSTVVHITERGMKYVQDNKKTEGIQFIANNPFLLFITHLRTGAIVAQGRVLNPGFLRSSAKKSKLSVRVRTRRPVFFVSPTWGG